MKKPAIAIIQARMSSTRFPGKVLKPLAGKPAIWHIYHRAKKCKLVDRVIIATSLDKSDDILVEYCESSKLNYFRGDLNNVLSRFINILTTYSYKYVVRITGDCPLIHPQFIDEQIKALVEFDADVVWSKRESSVLEGQGVRSTRSLFYIYDKTSNPDDLEHVGSIYFVEHPEEFKIVEINMPEIFLKYNFRLTVDEEKDYKLMYLIYDNLWKSEQLDLVQVLQWLDQNEELSRINKSVQHNQLNLRLIEMRRRWEDVKKVGKYKIRLTT